MKSRRREKLFCFSASSLLALSRECVVEEERKGPYCTFGRKKKRVQNCQEVQFHHQIKCNFGICAYLKQSIGARLFLTHLVDY